MNNCPVCRSDQNKYLFTVPDATVARCNECEHAFSHNLQVSPTEVYSEDYFIKHHKNWFQNPNYPLFKRITSMIKREYPNKNISILDIGCGNGDFLKYLHMSGFNQLTGIDFSKNEHPAIKFIQGNLFEIKNFMAEKYDVIVTLATIEHVEDVRQFVSILNTLVKPGGIICIMTLDENSFIYKLARIAQRIGIPQGVNRVYDKHHLNHFSKSSLKRLLQIHGNYKVIEHYTTNFPIQAIDLTKSCLNFFIRPAIMTLFLLTNLLRRGHFLQVLTVRASF